MSTCSMSDRVERDEREIGRDVVVTGRAPEHASSMRSSAAPTTSSSGCHSFLHLDGAGLEARHVEQVADEAVQALASSSDRLA